MTPEQQIKMIWSRCEEDGDCLIWRGPVDKYGTPMMHDRLTNKTDSVRRILARALGRQVDGRVATATCKHKLCMAETHIAMWTRGQLQTRTAKQQKGNVAWAIAVRRGVEARSKLSMEDARLIRQNGMTPREVMERWGVCETTARATIRGDLWKEYSSPFAGLFTGLVSGGAV